MLHLFVPRERAPREHRVAATPETVKRMVSADIKVVVEAGAGVAAHFLDEEYEAAGAVLTTDLKAAWADAAVVLKVAPPCVHDALGNEAEAIAEGGFLLSFMKPHRNEAAVKVLRDRNVTALAMELVPRITRAQPMDALSSQASLSGYKAAVLAANSIGRYFPLLMTAAGTIKPSRVVIIGAGVAGLQAVATARRLGAVVEVSDIRPAVKEEVESLGGKFIELPEMESGEGTGGYAKEMKEEFLRRQREILTERIALADAVITTALIPGRPAPKLVSEEMVSVMKPGSVVVDLAGEEGGNCALSKADEEVVVGGVRILAPTDLNSQMAVDSSTLYARNVLTLLQALINDEGALHVDPEDEVVTGAMLTHGGKITHGPTAERIEGGDA